MPKIIIIEGVTGAGQSALAQSLTHELKGKHLALYSGAWKDNLDADGHMIADELAVHFALALDTPVILEHSFPSLYAWQQQYDPFGQAVSPYKLMNLDLLVANQDHKGILLRYPSYEAWLKHASQAISKEPSKETVDLMKSMYSASDTALVNYVHGSKMDWLISDPFPDPERILKMVK